MADPTAVLLDYLRLYGPLVLCLFTFLESSMLFPFLPSEVVVPAAAAILVSDLPSFLVFVSAAALGGTAGAFVPFYVFAGRADWLGRYVTVSDDKLERGQRWFRRWGPASVLWGRFLPVFRSVVSIPAGLARMNALTFGVFTAVGTVGFYAATAAVVYYGRRRPLVAAAITAATDRPAVAALVALALVVLGLLANRVAGRWR